jgi:hypothetical protein
MGPVVAERRLRVSGRPDLDVRLRIGKPRPYPDDPRENYYCPYEITGLGKEHGGHIGGVDAIQAVELTLRVLPSVLDALRREYPGLGWEDAPPGDYGFTLPSESDIGERSQ